MQGPPFIRGIPDFKMEDHEDEDSNDKDLRYNVEVAKRMTVPDEIRLTGPSRGATSTRPSVPSAAAQANLQPTYHNQSSEPKVPHNPAPVRK